MSLFIGGYGTKSSPYALQSEEQLIDMPLGDSFYYYVMSNTGAVPAVHFHKGATALPHEAEGTSSHTMQKILEDNTFIIGIAGKARSGKDTVANFIQLALGGIERYSFATPLKEMLWAGLKLADKDPATEALYGVTYRHLAQTLGTEWGRKLVGEDLWIQIAKKRVLGKEVVITDIRMDNEADFVRKYGFIINITRPDEDREVPVDVAGHSTERGIITDDDLDFFINNDSTIENLELATLRILARIYRARVRV